MFLNRYPVRTGGFCGCGLGVCGDALEIPFVGDFKLAEKTGKPVVVAPHGSLDAWALNNSRWKKRLATWFFKDEQLRRATSFRALCEAEADAIRAYGLRQRIEIIPNGVELPDLLPAEDTEITEWKKRLLFLGRIHPKKGLVGALRAWAEICNSKFIIRSSGNS